MEADECHKAVLWFLEYKMTCKFQEAANKTKTIPVTGRGGP
jgi:hypothetical protein